ncbi:MAG: glycosyltransferase family 2 protein [Flavobacteriales bacterium]|nr:glycosyltransferase family 2 protein [Flavobacteriales bacterium]
MEQIPVASMVIPCLNEVGTIGACIDSLLAQKSLAGPLEIIVVDGRSDDGTREVLKRYDEAHEEVRYIDNPERFTPVAMNLGFKSATSDIVILLGAHAEADPHFVRRNIEALAAHKESGCVGGVVEQVHGDATSRRIGQALTSPFGVGDARFRTGGLAGHVDTVAFGAYRKSVLEEIGGVDPELVRNQDDELNYRLTEAGWRIWFDPRIRSTYHVRSSYTQLFRQYRQYGYWKVLVNKKHATITTWRQIVPAAFLVAIVCATAAQVSGLQPAALTVLISVWIAVAMIAALSNEGRLSDMPGVVLAFFTVHLAYGAGYLAGIVRFVLLRRNPSRESQQLTR